MKARLTIIVFFLVVFSSNSFAAPWKSWKVVQFPKPLPIYGGNPMAVEKVLVTKETIKNNKAYYSYKLIIKRPSGDNGWGVAYLHPMKYRLHYWAATTGTNPMASIHESTGVYQDTHNDPRKIVVHLLQGLHPGKYVISVAIFPYPMAGNYSFKDIIQFWRGRYVSFLFNLKDALAATHPVAAAAVFVQSYVQDEIVNGTLIRLANRYGERFELEVLAKMPKITTRYAKDAAHQLKMRNLVPSPDYRNTIPTDDKRFHGRVAKCQYKYGDWLKSGTVVAYKFYKYVKKGASGSKEPFGSWEFGRNRTDRIGTVVLTKRVGKYGAYYIDGYSHDNESYWKFNGKNSIVFLHKNGKPTTYFKRIKPGYWEGRFLPPKDWGKMKNAVVHYLKR